MGWTSQERKTEKVIGPGLVGLGKISARPVGVQGVECPSRKFRWVEMSSTLTWHLAAQPVAAGLPKSSMTLGAQPRGIHVKLTAGS